MTALVADLRACLLDPDAPPVLQQSAARHLAVLARAGVRGADPDEWWGMRPLTQAPGRRDPATPVNLSGTSLDRLVTCPLQWFMQHEAAGETARSVAMGFGSVIHALAHEVARGRTEPDLAALDDRLDRVWDQLGFQARWQSPREREEARAALGRLLDWLAADRGRTLVDTEVPFEVEVAVELNVPVTTTGGNATEPDVVSVPVLLRGFIDRLEVDADGQAWVVDFKTGKTSPTRTELPTHAQLGVYQYAVEHGALAERGLRTSGGAELVHLRKDAPRGEPGPLVQQQTRLASQGDGRVFVDDLLDDALTVITQERYPARPGDGCRFCDFHLICPAQAGREQVVT
jgi:RecB family exonuclease